MTSPVKRFQVDVPEPVLRDLRERLARTRLARDYDNADGAWGLPAFRLRDLIERWRNGYSWRAVERRMNEFEHYLVEIDGVKLHYVHVGAEAADRPAVLLTHGWPGSFWDFRDVAVRLARPSQFGGDPADSCDVVIPSLPGYDFSNPVPGGIGYLETADLWVELMRRAGYERFAAHGYDWGGSVTAQLGHRHGERITALHLASPLTLGSWSTERPHAQLLGGLLAAASGENRQWLLAWERKRASHLTVHLLEPQTLAYALEDSPAGLLAWLYQRRIEWSDAMIPHNPAVDPDDVITLAMLSWVNAAAGSSVRYYREATRTPWRPVHDRHPVVTPPAGLSLFRHDLPPGFDARRLDGQYNLVHVTEHARGGHFPSLEVPDVLARDIIATLRAAHVLG
jgi:pimeloyl-ACP methyl ester carboxylesterase